MYRCVIGVNKLMCEIGVHIIIICSVVMGVDENYANMLFGASYILEIKSNVLV